jgi:hypothetical protein
MPFDYDAAFSLLDRVLARSARSHDPDHATPSSYHT